ncbi:hypothetical protein ACPB8Q_05065 [Methanocaldococcus indicus]|uniref:hypothetical protein n=1 Tax=Methanocaldococcus indicus TaxID=213231 RepID=UPI003C6D1D82
MEIKTRKDLYEHLENNMIKSHDNLVEEGKYEMGRNLVKTYIVESNTSILNLPNYIKELELKIEKTETKGFWILKIKDQKRKKEATFYVDTYDPFGNNRFWLFYTVEKSEVADKYMEKLINPRTSRLDNVWLDKEFLLKFKDELGVETKQIGIKYLDSLACDADEADNLSLKVNGKLLKIIFNKLNELDDKHFMAITSIGFKKSFEYYEDLELMVIENLYFNGKFSVKGTSFNEHLRIVNGVRERYANMLKIIEEEYEIYYEKKDFGIAVSGSPLLISFEREIEDIEKFLDMLLSTKKPFRLAGFKRKIDKDYYSVVGLDLHNGDKFEMDVSTDWIRLYLSKGACGNTALRLVCNLQQYYDAETTLEGVEYGRVV